jgi:hypothetical protein
MDARRPCNANRSAAGVIFASIHIWRKQSGGNPILVAGRNRLEAHKRCGCEVISARVITGDTPETQWPGELWQHIQLPVPTGPGLGQ